MQKRQVTEAHRQTVVKILAGISNGVYYKNPTPANLERNKLKSPLSIEEIYAKTQLPRRIVRQAVRTLCEEGIVCTSQVTIHTPRGSAVTYTYFLNPSRVDDYLHYLGEKSSVRT